MSVMVTAAVLLPSPTAQAAGRAVVAQVTDMVTLEFTIGGERAGLITIGLFGKIAPLTTRNFRELAQRPIGEGYQGSKLHRVVRGLTIEGGDYTRGDGTGGMSIYGERFNDEPFTLKHHTGWVSMVNSGRDTSSSLFRITPTTSSWLDGKYVVFGKVLGGMGVVRKIENVQTDTKDRPVNDVVITSALTCTPASPFVVEQQDASEDPSQDLHCPV